MWLTLIVAVNEEIEQRDGVEQVGQDTLMDGKQNTL